MRRFALTIDVTAGIHYRQQYGHRHKSQHSNVHTSSSNRKQQITFKPNMAEHAASSVEQTADILAHAAAEAATPGADTESAYECPFCVMMRKGGCEDPFKAFMACGERADKGEIEMTECLKEFEALNKCMAQNQEVFDGLLSEMKEEEDKIKQQEATETATTAAGAAAGAVHHHHQQQQQDEQQQSHMPGPSSSSGPDALQSDSRAPAGGTPAAL